MTELADVKFLSLSLLFEDLSILGMCILLCNKSPERQLIWIAKVVFAVSIASGSGTSMYTGNNTEVVIIIDHYEGYALS